MTSSRVPTSAVLALGLLLATPLAFADQKSDLYAKGQKAVADGDSIGARDAFCQLPKDYQDADAQCKTYTDSATRTLNRYHLNYAEGMTALQSGDFDTAAAKFRNVKAGPDADNARQRLAEIPALKQKAADAANAANASAALEGQMKAKLDAGTNAWNSGDFNSAKSDLGAVTGSHQAEAQALLGKIRNYENAMQQGNAFMAAKDYNSAKNSFADAMRINPSGPGNPADMMAKAAVAANSPAPNTNTAVNTTPANGVKPPQPKPQIDVNQYLAEAQKAFAKKDYKKARRYLGDIFAQDRNNQEAKDLMGQVNGADTVAAKATDEDTLLLDIVKAFYAGSYQDAEDRLKVYIYNNQGKKVGLANFYLGASMMTRFYLSGGTDQSLKREAQNKFKVAKSTDGFNVPEKFVSPKIIQAFKEAS